MKTDSIVINYEGIKNDLNLVIPNLVFQLDVQWYFYNIIWNKFWIFFLMKNFRIHHFWFFLSNIREFDYKPAHDNQSSCNSGLKFMITCSLSTALWCPWNRMVFKLPWLKDNFIYSRKDIQVKSEIKAIIFSLLTWWKKNLRDLSTCLYFILFL